VRAVRRVACAIAALHVAGFGLLALAASERLELGTGALFGFGLGLTAYMLGVRHAFDADHIAAIDNVTRKLVADGQRSTSAGFFFSLGHSTIVFALALLLAVGVRGLSGALDDDGSTLHQITGVIGPAVAGAFLLVIGALNLALLVELVRVFARLHRGEYDEAALEHRLEHRGLLNRLYGRATRAVRRPWQMYPLGVLFGLGFDTATEVALLATAGTAAAGDLPLYAILSLPLLFAAGMSLFDTLDGAFMHYAYEWAESRPVRRVFYNLAVTALSVAVAVFVGLAVLTGLDLAQAGFVIVGVFAVAWAVALAVWRFGHIEERWSARLVERSQA
jgi:nickel/cobalt transporter (NiCoT) family protein